VIRLHITNVCLINNIKKVKFENQPVMKIPLPAIMYYKSLYPSCSDQGTDELELLNIDIQERDVELINIAVNDQTNRDKIINTHHKLINLLENRNNGQDKPEITVYTDGSLITGNITDISTKMGYEWTILT